VRILCQKNNFARVWKVVVVACNRCREF